MGRRLTSYAGLDAGRVPGDDYQTEDGRRWAGERSNALPALAFRMFYSCNGVGPPDDLTSPNCAQLLSKFTKVPKVIP